MRKSALYHGPRERSRWAKFEQSVEDSAAARIAFESTADESLLGMDPFDILAQLEEELGRPINDT